MEPRTSPHTRRWATTGEASYSLREDLVVNPVCPEKVYLSRFLNLSDSLLTSLLPQANKATLAMATDGKHEREGEEGVDGEGVCVREASAKEQRPDVGHDAVYGGQGPVGDTGKYDWTDVTIVAYIKP